MRTKYYKEDLSGPIKNIQETRVVTTSRKGIAKETRSSLTIFYDDRGNETETNSFDEKGAVIFQKKSEYNESNQIVSRKFFYIKDQLNVEKFFEDSLLVKMVEYNSDQTVRFKSDYLYDFQNRLIYFVRHKPDGTMFNRTEILYDRFGNRTEETLLDEYARDSDFATNVRTADGFTISVQAINPSILRVKFNFNNNPVSALYYNCENVLIKKYEIEYDRRGRLREVNEFLGQPSSQHPELRIPAPLADTLLTAQAAYSYAKQGDLNQSLKSIFNSPLETKTVYYWGEQEHLTAVRTLLFGYLATTTELSYGAKGELLEKNVYGADREIFEELGITWKFDERDNWTEQIITERKAGANIDTRQVTTAMSRKIEYYEQVAG